LSSWSAKPARPREGRHWPLPGQTYAELADHPLVGVAETCGFVAGLVLVKQQAGTMAACMFPEDLAVGMVPGHCFPQRLIMRAVGDRMIIAPPLTMTHAQIDEMMGLIRTVLDLTLVGICKTCRPRVCSEYLGP
jgi:putrescine aminotransferase